MSEWKSAEHALAYLKRADRVPHRAEGEQVLLEELPAHIDRFLDLGSGDGRLLELVRLAHPGASAIALDFSPPMLGRLRERFAADPQVEIVDRDLADPLSDLGAFDAVVSSFAIHHLEHPRKQSLYREIWTTLQPAGVFANLEHVSPVSPQAHQAFLDAMEITPDQEDPSNRLLDLDTQLIWLREIGFHDVDCYWKWRELALLVGRKPS